MAAMSRRSTTNCWILSAQLSPLEVELELPPPHGAWRHRQLARAPMRAWLCPGYAKLLLRHGFTRC